MEIEKGFDHLLHMSGTELFAYTTNMITKLVVIAAIIFVGYWFKKLTDIIARKICEKTNINHIACAIIETIFLISIASIVIALILIHLGVDLPSLTVIEHKIAALGFSGILLTLLLKNPLENFFAAHMMIKDKRFHVGDYLESKDKDHLWEGKVISIGKRHTTLQHNNQTIVIPNTKLYASAIGVTSTKQKKSSKK